jgi:hypothetical protein
VLPTATVDCPYCGESIELVVDDSVENQQYVEDCFVCCRPIDVEASIDAEGELSLSVSTESDA